MWNQYFRPSWRRAVARRLPALSIAILAVGMMLSLPAQAQIQRSFLNTSFEQPSAGASSCYFIIGESALPGWTTTHPAATAAQPNAYCPPNITATTPGATTGGQIELWANGHNGVTALGGTQLAELNAYQPSRLFQRVCLINGESIGYSIAHRGRSDPNVPDVAEFNIDSAANTVFRANTTNNGTGGVVQCGNTTVAATNGPVSGANDGLIAAPVCSAAAAVNGWRRYTGTITWNGANGVHDFGFEAISTSSGDPSQGNLMDEQSITLRPVIEFSAANFSTREGAAVPGGPQVTVVGTVPAGGIPVTVTVAGGTATSGSDFTTGTFTIPAGTYDTPTVVAMTGLVNVLNDTLVENNETLNLQIQPSPAFLLNSTNVCNDPPQATSTLTIVDNDVDVRTTKSVANANPPAGGTATFTITYQNNTARPTVGDLTAHDAPVNLADALPAGFTVFTWTCAASGAPAPTCPAASGSGAISATTTLPAGNGGAGGTLTYTVTGTLAPTQCAAVTNTSTIGINGTAVAEGTAAQAGFTTPAPGGAANNTASVAVDPGCLTLNKTTNGGFGGPFTFGLANTTQLAGSVNTVTPGTPTQVDGNAAAGMQPFGIGAAGTAVTIAESGLPANYRLSAATCSNGAAIVGGLAGSVYTIPAANVTGGTDFTCTFTNQAVRAVTLNKTLVPAADAGRFNLQVNGAPVATNVGNGGSGSNTAVAVGSLVTIAEAAGTPNVGLSGYATTLSCTGATVTPAAGSQSGTFTMPDADVSCTFTNTAIVNLVVTKTATPSGTYLPGQPLNYTITVTNNGPAAASGIAVADTVPANVVVTGWTCTTVGAGNDCDTGAAGTGAAGTGNAISLASVSLAPGGSLAIGVTGAAQLSATGAIVNTATATPPSGATCTTPPCTRSSTTTNTDGGAPQLTIVKSATPSAFAVGQPATYTLQVSNTGSSSTAGTISVSDPLPAGITATLPIAAAGWDCSASTATQVNCSTNAVLLPGSNAPVINVTVAVAPTTANPATNTATTQGGGDSSCPAATHCVSTTTTPVNAPRLDVTKSLGGNLVVGVPATYTIQVTNNGTADTLAGTVTDTVPTGLTIDTVSAGCTVTGQMVTCQIPAGMSPGQSISFTTQITPQASASGQSMTNNAVASGGGDATCPAQAHCTGTTTDTVDAPQLQLTKTATPNPFVIGVPATYTLTLTNTGTAATTATTTITDTIPGGLTIGAMPAGCTLSGQVVTCAVPSPLATNTPVSFAIPVTPQASLSGLSVTNSATATGGGDPSCPVGSDATTLPPRCVGTTTTNVNAPKLDIVKSASGTSFVVGVAASYTLQITNNGTAATTGDATVTDVVPADLVVDSAPGCTIAGQTVTCTIAAPFAPGTTTSFTINVTPTAAASGQTLANTASVQGGGDPTCPVETHCTGTTTDTVDAPQLQLTKTATPNPFVIGVPATYTLTLANTGTVATTAATTITDTIPGGLTIGTMPAGCALSGQVVTCAVPSPLATNTPVSFAIPVTPQASLSGLSVTNSATATGGGDPSCPIGGDATTLPPRCVGTTTTSVDAPKLNIVKSASGTSFVVGVAASYTLQVVNNGTAATTGVATVTDVVPADLVIDSAPGCTINGQTVTCTIAAPFAVGATTSFTINVTPTAAASGTTVSNTATVAGGGDPQCPLPMPTPIPASARGGPVDPNCSSTVDVPVGGLSADLRLSKSDNDSLTRPGGSITWALTVTNAGPNDAADVTVTDPLPPLLTYVSATGEGWTCAESGVGVTCTRPLLANGATSVITLTLAVPHGYRGPSPIRNTASVTSTTPDPDPPNNTGSDGTPVLGSEPLPVPALGSWALALLLLAMTLVAVQRRGTA